MGALTTLTKRRLPSGFAKLFRSKSPPVKLLHAEPTSWIARHLPLGALRGHEMWFAAIDTRARMTQQLGPKPLWQGFADLTSYPTEVGPGAVRSSEQVRTNEAIGRFFTHVVVKRRPELIVEFGTAFGVSGMYWLAGLEAVGAGRLMTFEPNGIWADIAEGNLAAIGKRYQLIRGTFEENVELIEPASIDLAFIDAIHTGDFVRAQLALVEARSRPGALIFLDDINFSADMRACWDAIAANRRYAAAAEIGRLGVVECR